ncbi:hypothetical protein [Natrialba taiwanensis]|uniref:Lipoprotein n=1 Tax=Natrialba taiwanensis DSM 12281 TaxID=1230458 RepID=L9ZUU2_9EURY|nr:hypothetical protein [Natrialba taiwanensis]ELY88928.1 hypothetical protein C484_15083 [Natrialba taiwanensis DSM 12281]
MRRLVTALLVALLVTAAGCSAFESSPDTEEREPLTVDDELVPGLSESGITDTVALSNAHLSELESATFERTQTTYWYDETDTISNVANTTQTVTDDAAYSVRENDPDYLEANETQQPIRRQEWRSADDELGRVIDATGETHVLSQTAGPDSPSLPVSIHRFDEVEHSVAIEQTAGGAERYRLTGAGNLSDGTYMEIDRTFIEFDITVTPSGAIETYEISRQWTVDGNQQTRTTVGEFTRGDDIELEKPAWVDDARAALEAETQSFESEREGERESELSDSDP